MASLDVMAVRKQSNRRRREEEQQLVPMSNRPVEGDVLLGGVEQPHAKRINPEMVARAFAQIHAYVPSGLFVISGGGNRSTMTYRPFTSAIDCGCANSSH
jgi:hypothetical protein